MKALPDDLEVLKGLVRQLLEENTALKVEVAELRRRLGLDSTNSDKPPSSDGYKKKSIQPGLPKERKGFGGQPGHQGRTLKRVATPDHIQVHRPPSCVCCGRAFTPDEPYEVLQSRQVFDVPDPRLDVTEHQIAQITCCQRVQKGRYPTDVKASVQYGAGVRALVTQLSVDHRLPLAQISRLFEDLYGYALNSTTIEETVRRGYDLAEPLEAHIKEQLNTQPGVHFDETGVRVAGKLHWLHVASTERWTHLFVHEKRGQDALRDEASILEGYTGTAVHDCWSAYFPFDRVNHRLCGAHLLRELRGLMEPSSSENAQWPEKMRAFLLDLYQTTCTGAHPEKIQAPAAQDHVRQAFRSILELADRQEPTPQPSKRGRPKRSKGRNLMDRLQRYENGVLGFAFEPHTPFTNNQAERDLRPAKVKQKVSGCFRTLPGAQVYARLQAILPTCRKQNQPIFHTLRALFSEQNITFA